MKFNYQKSQSFVPPELVDTTSSKTTVYLRKNIIQKTETDEISGEPYTIYEYDEAKLTKSEYEEYLKELEIADIEQQRADIDYIMYMTGLSEEVTE